MNLILDEELDELRDMVRRLVEEHSDMRAVRKLVDDGGVGDPAFWSALAELGLVGIAIPDAEGGSGATAVERAVILEELGRGVVPTPYLASAVLATDLLVAAEAQPLRSRLLGELASGERIGAVAVAEPGVTWPVSAAASRASVDGDGWSISGVKTPVIGAVEADVLFVLAEAGEGPAWFVVDVAQPGVAIERLAGIDPTRPLGRVVLDAARAERLAVADASAVAESLRDAAVVALSAEALGGHRRALEMTVDYAKIRYQFGRAIGSYQAVKHGLADVYSSLELSESVVRYAAWAAADEADEAAHAAALAHVYVPRAYQEAALAAIHFHGGIGFTWEHDAHFYFTRAQSIAILLGGMDERLERLAVHLDEPTP